MPVSLPYYRDTPPGISASSHQKNRCPTVRKRYLALPQCFQQATFFFLSFFRPFFASLFVSFLRSSLNIQRCKQVAWAGPGLLAAATGEGLVRFWDLTSAKNYVLTLPSGGLDRTDKSTCISFDPVRRSGKIDATPAKNKVHGLA